MAKDHVLPRYLLRAAVCICVLLSVGVLSGEFFHAKDAEALRLFAKDTEDSSLRPLREPLRALREPTLRETYQSEIGIRESTGSNDGSRVGEYLRYCGLGEGYAWCAAFVSWCHGQAGYAEPRNAWAAALFPARRTIWRVGNRGPLGDSQPTPRPSDVFGIHYINLKRIAHCGFVDGWDGKYCITVEGNTGPDGAVDGRGDPANPIRAGPDGVYRKRRPVRTIHAVARWTE